MSDCIPYKIQVSSVGVSTDLFDIRYDTGDDTPIQTASTPCGNAATLLTPIDLLNGYSVCLPADVKTVYIYDIGGVCDGRYTTYTFDADCTLEGDAVLLNCTLAGTITFP